MLQLLRAVSSADGAVVTGQIVIKKLNWSPTGAASLVLKDGAGNTKLTLTPPAAAVVDINFEDGGLFFGATGHQVSSLSGGGTVYLYG